MELIVGILSSSSSRGGGRNIINMFRLAYTPETLHSNYAQADVGWIISMHSVILFIYFFQIKTSMQNLQKLEPVEFPCFMVTSFFVGQCQNWKLIIKSAKWIKYFYWMKFWAYSHKRKRLTPIPFTLSLIVDSNHFQF